MNLIIDWYNPKQKNIVTPTIGEIIKKAFNPYKSYLFPEKIIFIISVSNLGIYKYPYRIEKAKIRQTNKADKSNKIIKTFFSTRLILNNNVANLFIIKY
tara:strand:+ start:9750 stop:10046 length:297 start_codon:yes stop_codon:yes gene_type:complete